MKTAHFLFLLVALAIASTAFAQGTNIYIYDQQSADESNFGEAGANVQTNQPIGQSFIPALESVGFIRLCPSDDAFNGVGTTMAVNLRSDSITGPILGSTDPVSLPDRFHGAVEFHFPTPVTVTPSVTYYFQPVIQAGESFSVSFAQFHYPNGALFGKGVASPFFDLWFREGIIVPEPSSAWLVLVGAGAVASVYWRRGAGSRLQL